MQITVRYFSHVRQATGVEREEMNLPENATLAEAIAKAQHHHPDLQPLLPSLLVTKNKEWAKRETTLSDGDEVGMMPPVSGG